LRARRPSAEAIGLAAAGGTAVWSTAVEFMPLVPKVVVGIVLSVAGLIGAAE
jgi:hypothetical protein